MARKGNPADIVWIDLGDGRHTYGQLLVDPFLAVYDFPTTDQVTDMTEVVGKPVLFVVAVNHRAARSGSRWLGMTLLGIGAMRSPRYRPAGLLLTWRGRRVMVDGGAGAVPAGRLDAWLVTDDRSELIADIRRRCRERGLTPAMGDHELDGVAVRAMEVAHTSHPTVGYLIEGASRRAVWAPEFWQFPAWAAGADLMFADAAGWHRPIGFAGRVGGHACVADIAEQARRHGVRRLVFAHLGRPSIRARDAGLQPPFGEWGVQGRAYRLRFDPGTGGGPLTAGRLAGDVWSGGGRPAPWR